MGWRGIFDSLLPGAVSAAGATGVLLLILFLFHKFFPRIYSGIREWGGRRIRSVRIGSYELLQATRLVGGLVALARWIRVIATVVILYVWLLFVLSVFPRTRGISESIIGYILDPLRIIGAAFLAALPDLFFLAVIGFVTRYVIRLARLIFVEVGRGRIVFPGFYADWAIPTFKIVRFVILAFALIVAFPYIPGSRSEAFKGVSIFLGILFSLGSTSAIANVMAGLSLTCMRAFHVGDRGCGSGTPWATSSPNRSW
ncbi:MAG: hypothetical protein AB1346_00690 [Thermodesulfobacteriota bacterium]